MSSLRRSLLLRDGVVFLSLAAISLVLFGFTLALFRSFEAHREALGRSWAARGQAALARHDAISAVPALRAALAYTPNDRAYQLLLAEALAGSGHRDEAANYFLNLWEVRPGNGFVNLQLARLSRQNGDEARAVEYYHAAIFGDWGSQGPARRRECRLELAEYLVERRDPVSARTELTLAASNAPNDSPVNLLIGSRLAAVGDLPAALAAFRKALAADPENTAALARAGASSFLLADYSGAQKLLSRALRIRSDSASTHPATKSPQDLPNELLEANAKAVAALARATEDLIELSLSRELSSETRASHLLHASTLAETRLRTCTVVLPALRVQQGVNGKANRSGQLVNPAAAAPVALAPDLQGLAARWKSAGRDLRRRTAAGNATAQDSLAGLVFASESAVAAPDAPATCGAPTGGDALLLLLARTQSSFAPPATAAVRALEVQATALATGARP